MFAQTPMEIASPAAAAFRAAIDGAVEVVLADVEVARGESLVEPGGIHVRAEERRARHGRRERLRAAHAAESARDEEASGQIAVEVRATAGREGLVGPLEDSLGPDVDPGAGRHLAEHRQSKGLEAGVLVARGPGRHEMAVGEQHARGVLVRPEHGDRLPRLHESVSSGFMPSSVRTIARMASQDRAARPVPPYTTSWSGASATSGSRLFISIRFGASRSQFAAVISVPRGARTGPS